jgi:hypothetical protein
VENLLPLEILKIHLFAFPAFSFSHNITWRNFSEPHKVQNRLAKPQNGTVIADDESVTLVCCHCYAAISVRLLF